jgi:hypothetical protein
MCGITATIVKQLQVQNYGVAGLLFSITFFGRFQLYRFILGFIHVSK